MAINRMYQPLLSVSYKRGTILVFNFFFFLIFNLSLEFATGKGYLFCLVMDKLNQHNAHVIQ